MDLLGQQHLASLLEMHVVTMLEVERMLFSVAGAACPAASTSVVPTECGVWGVSEWGQAKWRSERTQFDALREELDGRNRGKLNNVQDVLIAETALQNKMTLLTRDADLRFVAEKFGVLCADATELFGGTGSAAPEPS